MVAGDLNLDHTANEHIVIAEYLLGIQVLKASPGKNTEMNSVERNLKLMEEPNIEFVLTNAKQLAKDKPDKSGNSRF